MPLAKASSRACIGCFEKKLKCDREKPCSTCCKRKTACVYSHIEKPRKAPQRSARRIKEMEGRIQAMEALLRSVNMYGSQVSTVDLDEQAPSPGMIPAVANASVQFDDINEAFPEEMLGASVPVSDWEVTRHRGLSRQLVKRPLPSIEEALPLVAEYFASFNNIMPLYDEQDFMTRVHHQYDAEPLSDLAWWAALNVTIALAYRMRGIRTLKSTENNRKACGYIQNALNVAQDLTLRKPDLLSIQALLGIAIIMQGTPNPRPASIIVAAAVKLSQSLGLHRQHTLLGLSERQAEQCKRVFWIAYMLDKDFSLQLNQPPMQGDQDCDIELPADHPEDGLGVIPVGKDQQPINIFLLHIKLSIIQSETYTTVHSIQASKLESSARALLVENLDNRLNAWKRSVPSDFAPETLVQNTAPGVVLHLVVLYMEYFNCLTMIHSMSFRGDYWAASAADTVEGTLAGDPVCVGRTMCLPAARLAVRLVVLLPAGDFACVWLLLHYYVSAVVILLANIIQHPTDMSAGSDMVLVGPLLDLLQSLSVDESMDGGEDLRQLQRFCASVEGKAVNALRSSQRHLQSDGSLWLSNMPEAPVNSQAELP